eukprot:SAG31_NODE_38456_length_296_cov_0.751269_1_plen_42_part_10
MAELLAEERATERQLAELEAEWQANRADVTMVQRNNYWDLVG